MCARDVADYLTKPGYVHLIDEVKLIISIPVYFYFQYCIHLQLLATTATSFICAYVLLVVIICDQKQLPRLTDSVYTALLQVVHEWYLDSEGEFRKVLALNGYPYLRQAMKDGVKVSEVVSSMETSSQQAKFDTQLDRYQVSDRKWIERFKKQRTH